MALSLIEKIALRTRTNWSNNIVDYIDTMAEANIYIKANLKEATVGGHPALIRSDIDWSDYPWRTHQWLQKEHPDAYERFKDYNNADLIGEGYPPRDNNGDPIELHHIGQQQNSPYAELVWAEHMGGGNNTILHKTGEYSEIDRQKFGGEKSEYWQKRFNMFSQKELDHIYYKK